MGHIGTQHNGAEHTTCMHKHHMLDNDHMNVERYLFKLEHHPQTKSVSSVIFEQSKHELALIQSMTPRYLKIYTSLPFEY